jgi:hypothetical protein
MRVLFISIVILGTTSTFASESPHVAKTDSTTYALLKSLVGTWTGEDRAHKKTTAVFALVSNGRCIKETMPEHDGASMDTIFCDNGDSVIATHYCGAGNQPRFKSQPLPADKKSVHLDFLDATGMSSPDEGHMHSLVVELPDQAHLVQKWTFFEKGKPQDSVVFSYQRG